MFQQVCTIEPSFFKTTSGMHHHHCRWLVERGRWPPDHGWDDVGWRVRWGWCGPAGGQGGGGRPREWRLWRKRVEIDLQWVQVNELWEPRQELSGLEGCHPHIPRGQIRLMSGTAKEVGHRVVGVASSNGRNGAGRGRYDTYDCGSSCSTGSIGMGVAISTLLGTRDQIVSSIIWPRGSEEASDKGVGALFQHASKDEGWAPF